MKITDYRDGHIEPLDVFRNVTEQAVMDVVLKGPWRSKEWKVGTGLDRLKPEEREAIKNLKSEDTFKCRWPMTF